MSDELNEVELEDLVENNPYLTRKSFDVSAILIDGKMPEFKRDVESVMCAIDVGQFIRKNGLSNHQNLARYLQLLPDHELIIFLRQLSLRQMELMCQNAAYQPILKKIKEVAV